MVEPVEIPICFANESSPTAVTLKPYEGPGKFDMGLKFDINAYNKIKETIESIILFRTPAVRTALLCFNVDLCNSS